jgi:hypothetical protein
MAAIVKIWLAFVFVGVLRRWISTRAAVEIQKKTQVFSVVTRSYLFHVLNKGVQLAPIS